MGVLGALLILAVETGGEIALGVADEQREMVWYMVFAIVAAGLIIIFRERQLGLERAKARKVMTPQG